MPAGGFKPLVPVVKASHMHVCISYPFQLCTCLLPHVKLPFTPQEQSVKAPPFLKKGLSDDAIKSILKRPGSVIKALCIPALLHVCPCMCTFPAEVITFLVLYVYIAKAPAYLKGGSSHKPKIGKPLGYHPKEAKSGQRSPKKGLGLGRTFRTSHTIAA